MRVGVLCIPLLIAVAAQAQRSRDETDATQRACGVEDCFLEREIRDFEVIDQTHLIVYTGSQRCAFHVEVRGTFCDLTFAPQLYFSRGNELRDGASSSADPLDSGFGGRIDVLDTPSRQNLRICTNDLGIQVHGGAFTESAPTATSTDRFGNASADCRVTTVTSITDDQLVELYVKRRVIPPLPPIGAGEIDVGEQDEQGANAEQPEPEAAKGASRRNRAR